MANHNLGTIRGTIEIDYDGAGIVRAEADAEKAKKSFGGLDGASTKVLSGFTSMAKGAAKVAGAIGLVSNSVSLLSGLVVALAPLVGAAFATAPAVIASFAAALVITKVALQNVGDALKEAGEGGEKFDEALKKLSPNAAAFVKNVSKAMPALKAMQKAIQDAFFQGSADAVQGIVRRVVTLQTQARGAAFAIGQLAQSTIKVATSSKNIESLRTILKGVTVFFLRIKDAIGPVVTGFLTLAAQGSKFAGVVGGKLATALQTFGAFLGKIDLESLFATALPILQQFGGFLVDIGTIAKSIFQIFTSTGGDAVGTLTELVFTLAEFLRSAQGADLITQLGTAMAAVGGAAGQIFLALLQAVTPAIIALVPAVTALAGQITAVLVPAINALAPLLLKVSQYVSDNIGWLGPAAGVVVALAAAYKVYAAAARAVAAVQGILQAKIVKSTVAWIANTTATVANKVAQLASAAVTAGAAVAAWVASTAAIVANRIATAAVAIAMNVVKVATLAWTAVQWALNAALSANPIGLIVLAIIALVAGLIYAYKHSETFRNIVNAVFKSVQAAIKVAVDWIVNVAWPLIVKAFWAIVQAGKDLWTSFQIVWNGIKNVISAVSNFIVGAINFVKAVWARILSDIRNVATTVWNGIAKIIQNNINIIKNVIRGVIVVVTYIRNAFNNAKNAAVNALSALLSFVRSIPGRIGSALGGLGSLLYNKGRDLIRGFINGIGSMIGAVRDKVHSVVSAVTNFLPGSPAKEGPLSGKGYVLLRARRFMNDFAQGIDDGSQKPAAALLGSVGGLGRATVPTGSTTKSGASSAPTTAPATGGTREYHLDIDGKTLTTIVVDAITGNPVAVKKAADEGSRANTWAGSGRGN
jgi:phage-related protein